MSTDDLLLNLAHVSQQFNRLSKSPAVHIDVSVCYFVDEDKAAEFLRKTTLIRKLKFVWPTFWKLNFGLETNYIQKLINFRKRYYNNIYWDKLILSLAFHSHLKILDCPFLFVTSQCLALLRETQWWKRLTKIHLEERFGNEDTALNRLKTQEQIKLAVAELGSESCLKDLSLDIRKDELMFDLITSPACSKLKNLDIHESIDLSAVIDARKETLEILSLPSYNFKEAALKKLSSCKQLHTLIMSHPVDNLPFLPNLKNLTTLNLDMEVQWNWRYEAEVPANSLLNLKTLIIKMDVPDAYHLPDDDYEKHLELYEEHRSEIERYALDLVRASPNLTVFDLHSDVQCVTAEAFNLVVTLCPKLEKVRFHLYRNETWDIFSDEFGSVDSMASSLCKKLTNLKIIDLIGWTMSDSNLEMFLEKCKNLIGLHCNRKLLLKPNRSPDESIAFFECWNLPNVSWHLTCNMCYPIGKQFHKQKVEQIRGFDRFVA